MNELDFFSAFLMGFFGGIHCLGMCGGMAASIQLTLDKETPAAPLVTIYNLGRVVSYVILGALLALFGRQISNWLPGEPFALLRIIAAVLVISMGLYLLKLPNLLPFLERGGQLIWNKVQPLTRRLFPIRNYRQAFVLGLGWGLLPCGLVYAALAMATVQGDWRDGSLLMLSFGLGTMPSMLGVGLISRYLMRGNIKFYLQVISAITLIAYGAWVLWQVLEHQYGHTASHQDHGSHHQRHHHTQHHH